MLTWHPETRALKDLRPYEHNPRRMGKKALENLKRSLQEDGFHQRLLVDVDGTIIGGHSRMRAMQELGWKDVEVLVPSRKLSQKEFDRINIRDNLPFGDFDFDILGNHFDVATLVDWGMPEEWLPRDEEPKESPPEKQGTNGFAVVVSCGSEDEADRILEELKDMGYTALKSSTTTR